MEVAYVNICQDKTLGVDRKALFRLDVYGSDILKKEDILKNIPVEC